MKQTHNTKWYFLTAFVLLTGFIWYVAYSAASRSFLTVAFLDVGQGDAIFIEAPNGNQIVVAGGPDAALLSELGKVMPFYDKSLDMLVVTNPDKDHYAGFIDVMHQYSVAGVLLPGTHSDTETYKKFENTISAEHIPALVAKSGMQFV